MINCQNEDFLRYIAALEPILAQHGKNTDLLQKNQVNKLVRLERGFRRILIRHLRGLDMYKEFIVQCKNILSARPFFRARDETFKAYISAALKAKDHIALTRFDINLQFIEFVLRQGGWSDDAHGRRLLKSAKGIKALRHELIECNLPLAISQARVFFGRNKQTHLEYMDINQIAAIGLMEAVDKFVGPYKRAFRAVCIGRMVGDLIEENSRTFTHFYPAEKKTLYNIRKLIRQSPKDGPIDYEGVHKRLNDFELQADDKQTSLSDMLHIYAASQTVSANGLPPSSESGEEDPHAIEKYPAEHSGRPDVMLEEAQTYRAVAIAIKKLPLFDQKLLRMRGIDF